MGKAEHVVFKDNRDTSEKDLGRFAKYGCEELAWQASRCGDRNGDGVDDSTYDHDGTNDPVVGAGKTDTTTAAPASKPTTTIANPQVASQTTTSGKPPVASYTANAGTGIGVDYAGAVVMVAAAML